MNSRQSVRKPSVEKSNCPYCSVETTVNLPEDYRPVFVICEKCEKKFIAERTADGFKVFTREDAPRCSDPDCREIELGGGDEE